MAKITAIHSGGDWYDASVEYFVLPDGLDFESEKADWWHWYHTIYKPKLPPSSYISLGDWLLHHGAREPTDDELEIYED